MRMTKEAIVEKLHQISCDEDLPQVVRDFVAGACEALSITESQPPAYLMEGREDPTCFVEGWQAIRRDANA